MTLKRGPSKQLNMSDNCVIDLTLDDDDDEDDEDVEKDANETFVEVPVDAFLPIGVDVTDDVIQIDSDSDNERNLAEVDFEALQQLRAEKKLRPQQQGKFSHVKAIQAATRKRKRKLAEEKAERKRRQAEEVAERERKRVEEAAEWKRLKQERRKLELEQKRKAEAEALRKNPPTECNFIIIDSDPEEDLTTRRQSPPKKNGPRRFLPVPIKKSSKAKRQRSNSKTVPPYATTDSSCNKKTSIAKSSNNNDDSDESHPTPRHPLERAPQPYQNVGTKRVEFFRPCSSFRRESEFNYKTSRAKAQEDQERLFQEAAERMRKQKQNVQYQPPPMFQQQADFYGPAFSEVITNLHERYPMHWTWKSPHACLGLPPDASVAAAKRQYRNLVRCYHPDKSKQANTSTQFHAVVLAFNKIRQLQENSGTTPNF